MQKYKHYSHQEQTELEAGYLKRLPLHHALSKSDDQEILMNLEILVTDKLGSLTNLGLQTDQTLC